MRKSIVKGLTIAFSILILSKNHAAVLRIRVNSHMRIAFKSLNVLQNIRLFPLPDLRILPAELLGQCDFKIIEFLQFYAVIHRVEVFRTSVKDFHRLDRIPGKSNLVCEVVPCPGARIVAEPQIHGAADQYAADIPEAVFAVDFPGHIKADGIENSLRCLYRRVLLKIIAISQSIDPPFHDFHIRVEVLIFYISVVAESCHFFGMEAGTVLTCAA